MYDFCLGDMEGKVCPVIMDLSSPDSLDDFRPEAVAVSLILNTVTVHENCTHVYLLYTPIIVKNNTILIYGILYM